MLRFKLLQRGRRVAVFELRIFQLFCRCLDQIGKFGRRFFGPCQLRCELFLSSVEIADARLVEFQLGLRLCLLFSKFCRRFLLGLKIGDDLFQRGFGIFDQLRLRFQFRC